MELDASKLKVTLTSNPKPISKDIMFGQDTTDHMFVANYDPVNGWSVPEIKPYARLSLDPTTSCLHYATSVFEGMKAYRGPDGKPRIFRPIKNMHRLVTSAERVALPAFDPEALLKCLIRLVAIDERWIPNLPEHCIYIRPFMIGTREALGVLPSEEAMLLIVMSPAGPIFKKPSLTTTPTAPPSFHGVNLLAVTQFTRAWPGGTGAHKVAGNYAPGFQPQKTAKAAGYDQILYLLEDTTITPGKREYKVTEAGVMNFFVVLRREDGDLDLITPTLDGTILPGITRLSVLELANAHSRSPLDSVDPSTKIHSHEWTITLSDLTEWHRDGRLLEVLVVGTAIVIAPVGRIGVQRVDESVTPNGLAPMAENGAASSKEHVLVMPSYPATAGLGPVGMGLKTRLVDIQEGRLPWDDWCVVCQ